MKSYLESSVAKKKKTKLQDYMKIAYKTETSFLHDEAFSQVYCP